MNEMYDSAEQDQDQELRSFVVEWHTKPSPGATFYQGKVKVWAEDEDAARDVAQRQIWRGSFREYSNPSHIVCGHVNSSEGKCL